MSSSLQGGDTYRAFLEAKVPVRQARGIEVDPAEVNQALKPFTRDIVVAAARAGRFGIFSSFGLHKTATQLELARLFLKLRQAVPLIVLPLGVRSEFIDEVSLRFTGDHQVKVRFIRGTGEADEGSVNLTNYESVREGKVDPGAFGMASLDEADCLRGFGGTKTFREFMAVFPRVPYRFVATATPDPNEYIELLAYAAFLDIMEVGEAKTRFFKRDSTKADKLTIHPHKEREFWLWVASWSIFLTRPSDLGYSDDGYVMPELDVRWHEVPSDHSAAGAERDGQARMFRNAAIGLVDAAREKRDSLGARVAKLLEIRAADDARAHRIVWHDLEDERRAIEAAVPAVRSIYGSQDLETNERVSLAFKRGEIPELAAKPQMSGAGNNWQHHCHRAVYLGIGHKFRDFIQSVHRIQRFGQQHRVRLDLIYSEAERDIRANLEAKWRRHDAQAARMAEIIREFGLSRAALAGALSRSMEVVRAEASGPGSLSGAGSDRHSNRQGWRLVNNDCIDELRAMPSESVQLVVTSIPFATQYEYSPSYRDFGHTDNNPHFWAQMDFLLPELLRVVEPGRTVAVHVKDRIVPGGINGLGFQTVHPFSDETVAAFQRHGFAFMARRTIVTDVVRENAQTYRLGWSENGKDASRIGAGLPEYVLVFRRPPSDLSNGYADRPVGHAKPLCDDHGTPAPFDKKTNWKRPMPATGYGRAIWQLDAHGFWRSGGNRLLSSVECAAFSHKELFRAWRDRSTAEVYDFAGHVEVSEDLDHLERLPSAFMLLPPHSWHPDVWTDVARMRTLNGLQASAGREQHLCPLPFDIVNRIIGLHSMPGETVLDPFSGLGTVAYCALKLGRQGVGVELNPDYHRDAVAYLRAVERERSVPTLFDLMGIEAAADDAAEEVA